MRDKGCRYEEAAENRCREGGVTKGMRILHEIVDSDKDLYMFYARAASPIFEMKRVGEALENDGHR